MGHSTNVFNEDAPLYGDALNKLVDVARGASKVLYSMAVSEEENNDKPLASALEVLSDALWNAVTAFEKAEEKPRGEAKA